jgi:HEAT repeat protein
MPLNLPLRPSLERLRRQAKNLLRAVRANSTDALNRLLALFPGTTPLTAQLHQTQTVIARDYGYSSWRTLSLAVARRLARLDERHARDEERRLDAATLAETWFDLAENGDRYALWRALAVSKRRLEAARTVMQADRERYSGYVAALIDGLSDPNPRLRFEFAHALDNFGDASCIEPLRHLMRDPVPRVRWMAMHALTCHACGSDSCADDPELLAEIALHARADESIKVRQHATIALGLSGYRPIEPVVRDILATAENQRVRNAARYALSVLAG